jgi:hypothetical protein
MAPHGSNALVAKLYLAVNQHVLYCEWQKRSISTLENAFIQANCYVHLYELLNNSISCIITVGQNDKPTPTVCKIYLKCRFLEVGHPATVAPISGRAPS